MHLWYFRAQLILRYIAVSVAFMLGLILLSNYRASAFILILFAVVLGFEMAVYRIWRNSKPRKARIFPVQLLIQLLVFQGLIFGATVLLGALFDFPQITGLEPFEWGNLLSRQHLTFYIRAQLFATGLIFLFEIQDLLGRNFIWNYISGKYRRPVKETRLLLFMDLANSTTIAESIGAEQFYAFLNDCYNILSMPLIEFGPQLLKYVGDEVIVSWKHGTAKNAESGLALTQRFHEALDSRKDYFKSTYGHQPMFRSGLHIGEVMVAYVGDLKKQLDFSGDAMNTTARMCGHAKQRGAHLIMSRMVYDILPKKPVAVEHYEQVILSGRTEALDLVGLQF